MKNIKISILYTIGFILFIPFFLISFFKRTRFYPFKSHRLGHFIEDYYLYKKDKNFIDIFCFNKIGNTFLKKYISKKNVVFPKTIVNPIYIFLLYSSKKIFFFKKFIAYSRDTKKSNYENYSTNRKILNFDSYEKKIGNNFLKKINPNNRKIICLNITTMDHLKEFKKMDWSHHKFRKSNIQYFKFLINYFTEKGYLVIRMGHASKILNVNKNKNLFVDYAYKYRNDFLDFYLMSKAYCYISTSGGLDFLAFAFNKPMIISIPNIIPYLLGKRLWDFILNTEKINNIKIRVFFFILQI